MKAATVAFDGMREQYRVGLSTTLDVLIAQERLRDAELALAQGPARPLRGRGGPGSTTWAGWRSPGSSPARRSTTPTVSFEEVKNQGTVPWEHLIQSLDTIGAPADPDPNRPIAAPQLPGATVVQQQANTAPPADAPYSTAVPTAARATAQP